MRTYAITRIAGWYYVADYSTGALSRRFLTLEAARIALYGLLVRNMVNE